MRGRPSPPGWARVGLAMALVAGATWALAPAPGTAVLTLHAASPAVGSPEAGPLEVAPTAGRLVVDLVDGAGTAGLAAVERALGADARWAHPLAEDEALAVADVPDLAAAVAAVGALGGLVEVVEPSLPITASALPAAPDDPWFVDQWHLVAMGAPALWTRTPAGEGVVVAVVDTGVRVGPDLDAARVLQGATVVPGATSSDDLNGHGTHVAGTIAQSTHNGRGAAGVAPRARILPIQVLDAFGRGSSEGVAAGIDLAVDLGADVINLSLGGAEPSRVIRTAVRKARAAGVIIVAAAGNDGQARVSYPGAWPEVIGVAATGPDGALAPYSNRGRGVDLSAPGGRVVLGSDGQRRGGVVQEGLDELGRPARRALQGTSMAAPHVAGAAAALLSTGVASPWAVERLLLASADGAAWRTDHGWGRLDAAAAVERTGMPRPGWGPVSREAVLGALLALVVAGLGTRRLGFRLLAAVAGAVAAGGLPFAATWGGGARLFGALRARPLAAWPVVLLGPDLGAVGTWLAGFAAIAVVVVAAPWCPTRAVALGVAAGLAAHVVAALAWGPAAAWWMPPSVRAPWLGLQGVLAVGAALAAAGLARLEASDG